MINNMGACFSPNKQDCEGSRFLDSLVYPFLPKNLSLRVGNGFPSFVLSSSYINYSCPQLCSHCGWLLLKCSAIGIGFNGAETNCRIAHILGILLMNSCNTDRFLAATVVCGLSTLNTIFPGVLL